MIEQVIEQVTDLTAPYGPLAYFLDLHPDVGDFKADAIAGLSAPQKTISPKYFYDERGSRLFDQIVALDEYYLPRTEKLIFETYAREIADTIGAGASVFEYGSGSIDKIAWLLAALERPVAYVAMDISKDHLIASASALARASALPVAAICADFHAPVALPTGVTPDPERWLGYFPGSTLGNMNAEAAIDFLRRANDALGPDARFLLGVDLVKDKAVLHAAYNDAQGVTAAFNLNILSRMRRELDARVGLDDFAHDAFFNHGESRIEMHLRARRPTSIEIDGRAFAFAEGETLHTENSYKYTLDGLKALFDKTPWGLERVWTDPEDWFAACLLSNK